MTLTYSELAQGFGYDPASQVTQILHQLTVSRPPVRRINQSRRTGLSIRVPALARHVQRNSWLV